MNPIGVPILDAYLAAFESRALPACLACFADSSLIEFGPSQYASLDAIERWHRERWSANMKLLRIDGLSERDGLITIEGAVTSDRLKTWRLTALPVRAKFRIRDGKIAEARFGLRT